MRANLRFRNFWFSLFLLTLPTSLFIYPGNEFTALGLNFLVFFYCYLSFCRNLFFHKFLSVLLLFGFVLKFHYSWLFMNGNLFTPLGEFNNSYILWDDVILTASLAVIACIFSLLSNRYFYLFEIKKFSSLIVPKKNYFLVIFFLFSLIVALLNLKFGIHVKGGRAFSEWSPIYVNFFKWLIAYGLTGLAIAAAFYISENDQKKMGSFILVMTVEFLVQTSSMSRIFPFSALCLIFIMSRSNVFDGKYKLIFVKLLTFFLFSIVSLITVQSLRPIVWAENQSVSSYDARLKNSNIHITHLRDEKSFGDFLVRRWVGLESLAAVAAFNKKGFDLFYGGLLESKDTTLPSYFDRIILQKDSQYKDIGLKTWYAQNLPGFIAFSYYTGSYFFVILICGVLTTFCGLMEIITLKITNNPWLTGFIGFLLAYRLASFGYVVRDSYMFLLSILALIFLGSLMRSILSAFEKRTLH